MAKKRKNKRMRKRRWFTATERVEVWDRWQRGESSQSIGRVLDRGGSAIHRQLAVYGGIRPQSRCRSSRALTLVEREEISRGIAAKESIRSIAVRLGRSPSTASSGRPPTAPTGTICACWPSLAANLGDGPLRA